MKADRMGILSAMLASVCCLGPVLVSLLGLGSLGVAAVLGRYHWWFIGAAIVLLTIAWSHYVREAVRCRAASCEMARGNAARTVLTLASVVVATFVGLNLYTYASPLRPRVSTQQTHGSTRLTSVAIPVEGMTCFTCELTIESSLKGLPGVHSADAKVRDAAAYVEYDPSNVSVDELIEAINRTGYQARRPESRP